MTLRNGHGKGAGTPRVEVLPPDELPAATPALTARPDRDASGRFVKGNAAGIAKRVKPGVRGALGLDQSDPRYRVFARWGARYGAHRRRELARAHGGEISAGVGAIVESAAQAMAASRFVQSLAAAAGDAELFKQAAALASTARQHELAAWELAARESRARPKRANHDPWHVVDDDTDSATPSASAPKGGK
ncbi:MAG TPA: hypothetical protein VHB79_38800 [Polyangiaceae bacterium]|nr:hypothetical protein [Polyangiaceae bacterium]